MLVSKDILIDASSSEVRAKFLDFKSHEKWDPLLRSIKVVKDEGNIGPGSKLIVEIQLFKSRTVSFNAVVVENTERKFIMKGSSMFSFLFNGFHVFEFIPLGMGSTRLVQSETFSGWLVNVVRVTGLFEKTATDYEEMNKSFKSFCEVENK